MKTKHIMLIALTVGLSALNMAAQDNGRPPGPRPPREGGPREGGPDGPGRRMRVPPIIAALDANHDGAISAEEIANASAALKTLDRNNDGQLTMEELGPKPPEGGREPREGDRPGGDRREGDRREGPPPRGPHPEGENFHPPIPPIMAALDANGDKIISAEEIANASKALGKLDKNGDGKLTMEELRPERPDRPERPLPPPGNN